MSKKFEVRGLFADMITVEEADLARLMEALTANALLQIEVTESPQNEVTRIIANTIKDNNRNKKWARPTL